MRDLHNNITAAVAYPVAALSTAATTNGTSIDLQSLNAQSIDFQAFSGALTAGTFTLALYESADNSTFTAVDASDIVGNPATAILSTANSVVRLGYVGALRYVRASIVAAGGTVSGTIGVNAVSGDLAVAPSDTYYGNEA